MENNKHKKPVANNEFDSAVSIADSGVKYFLFGVIFLTVVALAWGIFGKIPIKINGIGTITAEKSERIISANYHGIVNTIYKNIGDTVSKGEKLVELFQLDLSLSIDEKTMELNQEIVVDSSRIHFLINEEKNKLKSFDKKIFEADKSISVIKNKIKYLEESYNKKKMLFGNGIISETNLKELGFTLQEQRITLIEAESKKYVLNYEMESYTDNNTIERNSIYEKLLLQNEQLKNLKIRDKESSYIVSSSNGIIQELLIKEGESVTEKEKIFVISELETGQGNKLFLDLFIPFSEKSKIEIGMDAIAAPFNVDKSRYGQLDCNVIHVSDYPASREYLVNLLIDEDVVSKFTSRGPVYYSKAEIRSDANTISGLKWTSKTGPPYKISPGMICEVEVHTEYVSPISFIVPWFKKGLDENE